VIITPFPEIIKCGKAFVHGIPDPYDVARTFGRLKKILK
jgi:hypothetical protein